MYLLSVSSVRVDSYVIMLGAVCHYFTTAADLTTYTYLQTHTYHQMMRLVCFLICSAVRVRQFKIGTVLVPTR